MKRGKILLLIMVIVLSSSLSCQKQNASANPGKATLLPIPKANNYNFTGSDYKGNYIWGGAMNLAWNELTENVVHETIGLVTNDTLALKMLNKLNNPVITANDLDAKSYYIKSGFGNKTRDMINRECRFKFPKKTFADIKINLNPTDIISYAYFLKDTKYQDPFEKSNLMFKGNPVKGFEAVGKSRENIDILDYTDEDHFIVAIKLKDAGDQIFLAKGLPMDKPDSIIAYLRKRAPGTEDKNILFGQSMEGKDIFKAPMLNLSYNRIYKEMIDKVLTKKIEDKEYFIKYMYENIKFDMDETGARVENEGVISSEITMPPPSNKTMKLDKPYWIVMKRFDSNNPYFILGVRNTEFMKTF